MPELVETAYAKINLALHVRRRRDDGYHDIETLFAFAEDGDRVSADPSDNVSLNVIGPFSEGLSNNNNLVVRTAEMIRSHFGKRGGAAITLDKRLPVASGIGGGSADAAATARLLLRLWSIEPNDTELEHLLAPLGADIPACVQSRTVFGDGIGTELQAVSGSEIRYKPVLLVNPRMPVATAQIFKAWDGIDRGELDFANPWRAALTGRNDLEDPAINICPAVSDVLNMLKGIGADLVRMSGSGATCFALYASTKARDKAQSEIAKACPEWWTMASSLR